MCFLGRVGDPAEMRAVTLDVLKVKRNIIRSILIFVSPPSAFSYEYFGPSWPDRICDMLYLEFFYSVYDVEIFPEEHI